MHSLQDLRVLVTRPRNQAHEFAHMLRSRGAIPIHFPVIEIAPMTDPSILDRALLHLHLYDWLVLTSTNGVEAVGQRLELLGINSLPVGIRVAAIGLKTASALEERGIMPDLVPDEYIAEAILPGLGDLPGKRVLLARADIARKTLVERIRAGGARADDISAYKTVPAKIDENGLLEIQAGLDLVTFTSSSTVTNFIHLMKVSNLNYKKLPGDPLFACIGPITAKTARQHQIPVAVMAKDYTAEGLIAAIDSIDFSRKAELI